ncbi:hypothetical protein L2E82_18338 [Cichorium intybus]|uniref:Uncharacterized protein n=1 Tax=Cichorium intybus TaxID=13427 RepID=A0ACB9F9G0_CICIN|nr:hypothetical protein L2E82_18338 [Cichorium intybus]
METFPLSGFAEAPGDPSRGGLAFHWKVLPQSLDCKAARQGLYQDIAIEGDESLNPSPPGRHALPASPPSSTTQKLRNTNTNNLDLGIGLDDESDSGEDEESISILHLQNCPQFGYFLELEKAFGDDTLKNVFS